MKTRFGGLCPWMALAPVACFCLSALAVAQDSPINNGETVRARYAVLAPKPAAPGTPVSPANLQTWNGSFISTTNGQKYNYVMVGADPATNQAATIPTFIIPVKIVLSTGEVFDPLGGSLTGPLGRTISSPIFDSTTTYTQGGVNVGTTQYIDAFQRANFWKIVGGGNSNSHLLLGTPTLLLGVGVATEYTLHVPSTSGHLGHPFNGHAAAEVDINYFDTQISNYMTANHLISPAAFPIFLTYDTYLTEGGCCIGGYHSANGQQTYTEFTYVDHPGDFSQDVSALSHEIGEWADDPLTNGGNNTPCGILEDGDPLETHSNYGSTPYVLHGFTYNLQDLTFLRYFGAPVDTSVNSWWTFQNYPYTTTCQQGSNGK